MKPAMITHLTIVVVADASFGRSHFRSEPFLRRFFSRISRILKNRPRNAWETVFRRETPILTPIEKRLAQPQRPLRILVLSSAVEGSCLAWSWAFQGCTQGSHIQKIRQTNTAETPLVILIKKHHETKKKKKKGKIAPGCTRRSLCSRTYHFKSLAMLWESILITVDLGETRDYE